MSISSENEQFLSAVESSLSEGEYLDCVENLTTIVSKNKKHTDVNRVEQENNLIFLLEIDESGEKIYNKANVS